VIGAETFWHKLLDELPHQLGSRVAKDPLGFSIKHYNLAGPVAHHRRVWKSLDD
jgi:hypothetical protein